MELKISFGIIVLNGEPFTRYCIRALYPHAYQIIIAEGACYGAKSTAKSDGHSSDGTLEVLKEIKKREDPDNKIQIVTAEDEGHENGFWPGEKHEQSEAYAKRATGDYLWQVDIDEFYKSSDIERIKRLLKNDPSITAVSFFQKQFWGGLDYLVDSWYLRRGMNEFHRLFKWGPGYKYISHRPPTVLNSEGNNARDMNWINKKGTMRMGVFLYHYSFVFPKQVKEKALYYRDASWSKRAEAEWWANDVFMKLVNPYRVFSISSTPSWLMRYKGSHPGMVVSMYSDIAAGNLKIELRKTDDIDRIISSPLYNAGIICLKFIDYPDRILTITWKTIRRYSKAGIKKLRNEGSTLKYK